MKIYSGTGPNNHIELYETESELPKHLTDLNRGAVPVYALFMEGSFVGGYESLEEALEAELEALGKYICCACGEIFYKDGSETDNSGSYTCPECQEEFDADEENFQKQEAEDLTATNEAAARKRVSSTPDLAAHSETIFYKWPNWGEHVEWVATAPAQDIVDWAKSIEAQRN